MRDHEFDDEAGRSKECSRPCRWCRYIGLAFVVLLGSSLLGFPGCSRTPYTCAVCREDRVDHRWFGLEWSDQEDSECSRWYQSNVEPAHAHCWAERTHCRRFGIPGLYSGYACFVGGPITGLSKSVQIDIYKHFENRIEAKQLFVRLGQGDYRPWDALMGWVDAGYPGTWHDWWESDRESPTIPRLPTNPPGS